MDKLEAITLENDLQYVIISTLNHHNDAYILVANITGENETGDELEIFKATQDEEGLCVEDITDENIYNEVKSIFDEKLQRFAQNNAN